MSISYILNEGKVVTPEGSFEADLRVTRGLVREIGSGLKPLHKEIVLDCAGQLIFPGLINSHDHLAFNLFARFGGPPYDNAYEWGRDLHRRWSSVIERIHRIPLKIRLQWGAWKNLFSGVTWVIHHDAYSRYFRFGFPVSVLRRYTFAHSLQFEPDLQQALRRRKRDVPFMIHLAEGRDDLSAKEVTKLRDFNGLDSRTVAIHAIAVTESDIKVLKESGASVVWCPSSNMFLFGKTAPVQNLVGSVPLTLGTDSTLTGEVTLFEELRTARQHSSFSVRELFSLVTETPRRIFHLPPSAGTIRESGQADIFLLPDDQGDPLEKLISAEPGDISLLMRKGRILFYSPSSFKNPTRDGIGTTVRLNGQIKYVQDPQFSSLCKYLKPFLNHYSYFNSNQSSERVILAAKG